MKACQIVEVLNGREKGVIDPRHTLNVADMDYLIAYGVDDITVRRPPVELDWIQRMRIKDGEIYLRDAGWVQWGMDHYVWLRPGHKEIKEAVR